MFPNEVADTNIRRYEDYPQMGRYVQIRILTASSTGRSFRLSHDRNTAIKRMLTLYRFTLRDKGQTIAIGKITKLITDPAAA